MGDWGGQEKGKCYIYCHDDMYVFYARIYGLVKNKVQDGKRNKVRLLSFFCAIRYAESPPKATALKCTLSAGIRHSHYGVFSKRL